MSEPVTTMLRCASATAHQQLEQLPKMQRLLKPDYAQGEYIALLECLASAYTAIEAPLRATAQARQLNYQPRLDLVQQALGLLGKPLLPSAHTTGKQLLCAAECWGRLYVLEGSALGGQLIQRHLQGIFAGLPLACFAPFHPYAHPGQHWLIVRQALNQALTTPALQEIAIASALETFQVLHAFLADQSG